MVRMIEKDVSTYESEERRSQYRAAEAGQWQAAILDGSSPGFVRLFCPNEDVI